MLTPEYVLGLLTAASFIATVKIARRKLYCSYDIVSQIVLASTWVVLWIITSGAILASFSAFSASNFSWLLGLYLLLLGCWLVFWPEEAQVPKEQGERINIYLVGVLLLAVYLSLPPSAILVGGQDPSLYVARAFELSRTGSPNSEFPIFGLLSLEEKEQLLGIVPARSIPNLFFPGVVFLPEPGQELTINFPSGPSYFLAYALLYGDENLAFCVNSLVYVLAVASFFLLVKSFLNDRWAFAAGVLLALCPAQLWFGRASYSEVISQLLIVLSAFHLFLWNRTERPRYAVLAIWASVLSMSMRCDQVLAVAALSFGICWQGLVNAKLTAKTKIRLWSLLAVLVVAYLLGVVEVRQNSWYYFLRLSRSQTLLMYQDSILTGVFLFSSLALWEPVRIRVYRFLERVSTFLRSESFSVCLISLLILFFSWGFIWRTQLLPQVVSDLSGHHNAFVRTMQEESLHRMAVLVGLPVLLFAIPGVVFALRASWINPAVIFLAGLFIVYGIPLTISSQNSPQLYWSVRRLLPIVVPGLLLFGLIGLSQIALPFRPRNIKIFRIAAISICLLPMLFLDRSLVGFAEMRGAEKFIPEFKRILPPTGVVIVGDSTTQIENFGLRFFGGYEVLPIKSFESLRPDKVPMLRAVLEKLKASGRRIAFVSSDPNSWIFKEFLNTDVKKVEVPYSRLGEEISRFPTEIYPLNYRLYVQSQL